ncbi:MAG TPA: maleylpyruvate isomerase family mycothiol-dependent enzyme [Acidimicrobiia bacterium]|nr:maleylpyruvate isomerase family mycothiol-dependent enzyme [Acidimicrobiia bacterium]
MEDVLAALADQHAQLDGLLATFGPDGWQRQSRCEEWTAADVVLHLAQTDELALASVEDRFDEHLRAVASAFGSADNVDDGAAALVAAERGAPPAVVYERWRDGAASLRAALAARDPHARVQWVAGRLSVHTLTTTRLAEAWIHTGDVANAVGVDLPPTDALRHVARLAWRTLPYAFERAGRRLTGAVAFELRGPGGDTWTFAPSEGETTTTIRGDASDVCLVAARRVEARDTTLVGDGPDATAVLELVRTYA